MNRRWICGDVWMDILPSFDHAELGLKMALLSYRFDALVDAHFDGKTEFTLWKAIEIRKDIEMPKLFVEGKSEGFPLPDRPLPNEIRFKQLRIEYIDHSVIEFLHANKQIWDRIGINLGLSVWPCKKDIPSFWDVFYHQIWPIFAANIRQLSFPGCAHLDTFLRLSSPTLLNDLDQLDSIDSDCLFSRIFTDADEDWPNSTSVGKALIKWLHTPRKNGQPKRLFFDDSRAERNSDWLNTFKETFCRATASSSSVSYKICFGVRIKRTPIVPFELVNERTNEKLTLTNEGSRGSFNRLLLKRWPIRGETAAVQWKNDGNSADTNLNNVFFDLHHRKYIGPLSQPAKEKAGQSSEKGV